MKFLMAHSLTQPVGRFLLISATLLGSTMPQVAQAIAFVPASDHGAPTQAEGGASRGTVQFTPDPERPAPSQAEGGASRGEYDFIPDSDRPAPNQSQSGGSRGEYDFVPDRDQASPDHAAGGASRGEYQFIPDTGRGAPEDSVSGASRAPRPVQALPEVIHLSPALGANADSTAPLPAQMLPLMPGMASGLTVSGHPTFFFYLPESAAQSAVFRLKDEAGTLLYEQVLPNVDQAGVVAIQLPADVPALSVGQYYQWYVALQFDTHLMPASPFVSAWIERIEPPAPVVQAQTGGEAFGETLDYAAALAASGVWYDAIATLNALRIAQPNSVELDTHWQELLTSVKLSVMAHAPITTYVQIQPVQIQPLTE